MALFDIFGDHLNLTRQTMKNAPRQPLTNIENMGKMVSAGPIKPNEPAKSVKKGETKKSFLSNTGKALQGTPRTAFTPRTKNVVPIYNDETDTVENGYTFEELEFTKPVYLNDNYHKDALDYLPMPELQITEHMSPLNTPPPTISRCSMELIDCSYQDDVYTSLVHIPNITDEDLELPDLSIEYISDESLGDITGY